ncbi:Ig-like domain-containing protein, partial [Vibrio ouci]
VQVSVDTANDKIFEGTETFKLDATAAATVGGESFDLSASGNGSITDERDNPPESEDFTASVASTGKTQIVFDHTDPDKDHISDDEDDAANKDVHVVITELPDHGTLYYNGVEITEDQLYSGAGDTQYDKFDPDLIEYEPDADSEGFVLGLHSSADEKPLGEDDQSASREDFYNWGTEVNSTTRELDLGGNDKVIISSNGGALTQYRGDATAKHVGHGIGIGAGQGINDGEVLSIDFATRPADSITLGLDGLGGYFEKGLGNSNESSVEITVYFEGGSKTFTYQKGPSGNDDLFHELTIPSAGFELPDGTEITRVELTTDGPGNWELRYLETELSDAFDYRAVDSDGNFSEESTVTIADQNADPVAVNDPEGFSVSLGSLNDAGSWQSDGASMSASYQGVAQDVTEVGIKRGVGGHENGGIEEQIQFNRDEGVSEQLEITLEKPATQFSFEVSNLFKGEGGSGNHEQGKWIAYLDGVVVASDTFIANTGKSTGSYTVDLNGKAFDSIVFESTDFVDVPARGSDSSDYFLTGFAASSPEGAYAVNQGGVLEVPLSELLANDSDPDNDSIRITYVYGEQHGEAYIKEGKVYFDLDDDFVGTTEFKYQITDDNGGFDEATVKVIVNPEPTTASVDGISLLSSSVDEGQSLAYKVALDESTLTEARFKVTLTGAQGDTADGDDVDLSKVVFTNGVTYDQATDEVVVPVGVKDFTILIPTINDSAHEGDETYTVTIDGKTATGTIIDNDVTIKVHDAPRVNEGEQALFKVELSEATSDKHYVKFEATTIGYDSETDDIDVDSLIYEYRDINGYFQTATVVDGYVEIPAGVTELRVSVQTVPDDKFEWTEKFGLHIIATKSEVGSNSSIDEASSDLVGVGSIKLDNADNPTLTLSNATPVDEGDSAVFVANLSKVSEASIDMKVEFVFSANASLEDLALDSAKPYEGVTVTYLHKGQLKTIEVDETDGTFTLPARVTDFKVNVDTVDDGRAENSESFNIKLSEVPFVSPTDGSSDVIINHGQLGVTASGTILDNDGNNNDGLPTAGSFPLSSEHSVVRVEFADKATDDEDDQDDSKVTSVRLESLPTEGDLYYKDAESGSFVKITQEMIKPTADGVEPLEFPDDTEVYYVVDRANAVAESGIDRNNSSSISEGSLTHQGITLSGGSIVAHQFVNDGQVQYDGNPAQGGYYTATGDEQGKGKETQFGEYISIKSDQGNMSSLTIDFDSLNGQIKKTKIVAHLFDNGQPVGEVELTITDSDKDDHNHAGMAVILPTSVVPVTTFDEVRLTVKDNVTGGFNIAGIQVTAVGDVAINDSFDYWAVDSDDQLSPTTGTVTIDASTAVGEKEPGGVDNVVYLQGFGLDWSKSAATIFESESKRFLDYDPINGAVIDVGIASDTVTMGSGSDTIYLGEGHSPGVDLNVDPNAHDQALIDFATNTYDNMFDTLGDEDSGLKGYNGASNPGLDVAQAGGGNDVVYGEGGQDIIFGGTGHDILDGGEGDDAVRGGSGNDTIIGGAGNDILVGDDGADIFKWVDADLDDSVDIIKDFDKDEGDKIDLSDLFEGDTNDVDQIIADHISVTESSDAEHHAEIIVTKGTDKVTIELEGWSMSDLTDQVLKDILIIKD